jgi:LysM repeat protein
MGRMIGGWCRLVLLLGVLGIAGSGCAWYDGVVERQDLRLNAPVPRAPARVTAPTAPTHHTAPAPSNTGQHQEAARLGKEAAALRVEVATLQDRQRRLLSQVGELEDELAARDKQIKELNDQLSGAQSGRKTSDAEWQRRLDEQRGSLEAQNRKAQDAMAKKLAEEMAAAMRKAEEESRKTTVASVHTVRQGEVLSVIAAAYRVPLKKLMAVNGLKNDIIRVGQKLKIPAPSR